MSETSNFFFHKLEHELLHGILFTGMEVLDHGAQAAYGLGGLWGRGKCRCRHYSCCRVGDEALLAVAGGFLGLGHEVALLCLELSDERVYVIRKALAKLGVVLEDSSDGFHGGAIAAHGPIGGHVFSGEKGCVWGSHRL